MEKTKNNTKGRIMALCLYYGLGRYLPDWIPGGLSFRRLVSKAIFKKCGKLSCAGYMAYFGNGIDIEIGDYSAIGTRAYIGGIGAGGRLIIGNFVMMAPEVVILTQNHNYNRLDFRCVIRKVRQKQL